MAKVITMTPDQLATNWKNGMTNAVTKIQDGVSRVTDSPMQKAAAAQDRYLAGVNKAVQSGRFANALNAVDLNTWKNVTKQKVGERLAGGATAAVPKVTAFAKYLIPAVNNAVAVVDGMPKLTLQDSINRAAAFMTTMAANPYKG